MSKERRVDPQVTVGLLTDRSGFPLAVHLFEGNKAETKTVVPVLTGFRDQHPDAGEVIVVGVRLICRSAYDLTCRSRRGDHGTELGFGARDARSLSR